MKRLIALCVFVYGFLLLMLAGWHLAQATDDVVTAWVVYSVGDSDSGTIYRVRINGTGLQKITQGFSPRISPDGKWIIFHSTGDGTKHLYRMRLDGSQAKRLTPFLNYEFSQSSRTSNDWILVQSDNQIYRIRWDGSQLKQLWTQTFSEAFTYTLSPDGNDLLATWGATNDGTTYRVTVDNLAYHALTSGIIVRSIYEPQFTPDGQWIVFEAYANFRAGDSEIYKMRLDGSQKQNLSNAEGMDWGAVISPDSQWLVFRSNLDREGLYRVNLDGSQAYTLVETASDFRIESLEISPNGQWVIFTSNLSRNWEIYRVRPDGSQLKNLTHSTEVEWFNRTSPDGQWIFFVKYDTSSLYRMRLDGSDVKRIAGFDSPNVSLDFAPLFPKSSHREIWLGVGVGLMLVTSLWTWWRR